MYQNPFTALIRFSSNNCTVLCSFTSVFTERGDMCGHLQESNIGLPYTGNEDEEKHYHEFMKRRTAYLDSVGGIMIIYMIFYHCCQFSETTEQPFFQSISIVFGCFMAWFFFKSGMFHKDCGMEEVFKSIRNKLLRPYCAFMLIGYIAYCIDLFMEHDYNWVHYILSPIKQCLLGGGVHAWALPMWFLVTLVIVKCLSQLLLGRYGMGEGNCMWLNWLPISMVW